MTNLQINLDWNWRKLHDAFFDDDQYVTIDAGRGSGKTRGAFLWIVEELAFSDAITGLWMDTIHNNIDAYVEEHLQGEILKDAWKIFDYNYKRKRLNFPNGKYIQFASAEKPQNAEGFRYHRVVLNEAGLILKKPSLWDNSIEPMTHPKDGIKNKTRLVGTMKGKNKFWQLSKLYKRYHFEAQDSPNWTLEELEEIKSTIPHDVYMQEYLSIALDNAGMVFRNFSQCIKPIKTTKVDVLGVDLAKYQDFTVIAHANSKSKEIIKIDRFNQLDWTFQKNIIYNTWKKAGKPKVIIDSTGIGDAIFDDLKKLNMNITPYKLTNTSKSEIIQKLAVSLENQELFIPNDPLIISELELFGFEVTKAGNVTYSAPQGFHDDIVIAIALANYMIENNVEVFLSWI